MRSIGTFLLFAIFYRKWFTEGADSKTLNETL